MLSTTLADLLPQDLVACWGTRWDPMFLDNLAPDEPDFCRTESVGLKSVSPFCFKLYHKFVHSIFLCNSCSRMAASLLLWLVDRTFHKICRSTGNEEQWSVIIE